MQLSFFFLHVIALSEPYAAANAASLVRAHSPQAGKFPQRNTTGVLDNMGIDALGHPNVAYTPLRRCALVGSSAGISGKGLGSEIDAQDTVIRVNRLPSEAYFNDFGQRTDVLFGNRQMLTEGVAVMGMTSPEDPWNQKRACASNKCGLLDCRKGGARCSFGSAVFKREQRAVGFEGKVQAWREAPFPIASTARELHPAAEALVQGRPPSTGFLAFLAYFALCDELRVYGFDGNAGTADGHATNHIHSLDREHYLMTLIAAEKLTASAWKEWEEATARFEPDRAANAVNWIQEHILKRRTALSIF